MEQKRYVIKIYDRETGGEYEFDGDNFSHNSQRGLTHEYKKGTISNLKPNGQDRSCFKIWNGFEKWEDFEERTEVDVT